jgi:hypothetical protein
LPSLSQWKKQQENSKDSKQKEQKPHKNSPSKNKGQSERLVSRQRQ